METKDEIRVKEMAQAPPATDCPHACYIDPFVPSNPRDERLENLKSMLANGKVIVMQGAKTHPKVNLTYEEVQDLNLQDTEGLDVHG